MVSQKVIEMVLTIFITTILIFILIRFAPGDPVKIMMGNPEIAMTNKEAYDKKYKEMRKELNLDDSLTAQYVSWINRVAHFDLGKSIYTRRPVGDEIRERLPATILLAVPSLVVQTFIGVSFGIISAVKKSKLSDVVLRLFCVIFSSIPAFALSLMLLYCFGVHYNYYEISNSASLNRLWLPTITLGLISSSSLIRVVRTNMLQELGKDYISFAIARGLDRKTVIKNALKNIWLPIITILALSFTSLLGGAVVIESVFTWPGVGKYALDSILLKDYPVIQGYGFIMTSMIVLINFIVDIIYICIDPKIKVKGGIK